MLLGGPTEPPGACEGTVGGCLGLSTVGQCRQLWLRVSQTPKQAQPPPGTVGAQAQANPLGGGIFIFLTARLLKGFLGLLIQIRRFLLYFKYYLAGWSGHSPQAGTCLPSLVEFKASRVLLTPCSARDRRATPGCTGEKRAQAAC